MLYCLLTLYRFSPIILLGTHPNNEKNRATIMSSENKYAGTQTERNLWEAFAGESQAGNKYSFFAAVYTYCNLHGLWVTDADLS